MITRRVRSDFSQVQRGNSLPERDGKVIEFPINLFLIVRHGPRDIVRIYDDDVEPLMHLFPSAFAVLSCTSKWGVSDTN